MLREKEISLNILSEFGFLICMNIDKNSIKNKDSWVFKRSCFINIYKSKSLVYFLI